MGVKYSGKVISTGKLISTEVDSPSGPQGVNLLYEYDATLETLPGDQGWTNVNGQGVLVIDEIDGNNTLSLPTVDTLSHYMASPISEGWMAEFDIRVARSGTKPYSHTVAIRTDTSIRRAFEFSTDRIEVYASSGSFSVVAYDDFQTSYKNIKLLDNTETGNVELYIDDILVNDSISTILSSGFGQGVTWGDLGVNAAGRVAFWRTVKVYESWSK